MKNKQVIIFGIIGILLLYSSIWLVARTGFLQKSSIDNKDLEIWNFDENGVIVGSDSIELQGNSGKCWVMAHGYTTTPDELRIIAVALNEKFNDTVYVPRLFGHATLPSNIEKYSVDDWYKQIEDVAKEHRCQYFLGSSMGASIVLRYSELHDVKVVVVSGLTLDTPHIIIPVEVSAKILFPLVDYIKRTEPGETIIDPQGKKAHVSTYSFPLKGVVELFEFNKNLIRDLKLVKADVLFLHGSKDEAADIDAAKAAYDGLQSRHEFYIAEGSHIVFRDYSKEQAVEKVLEFRASLG